MPLQKCNHDNLGLILCSLYICCLLFSLEISLVKDLFIAGIMLKRIETRSCESGIRFGKTELVIPETARGYSQSQTTTLYIDTCHTCIEK